MIHAWGPGAICRTPAYITCKYNQLPQLPVSPAPIPRAQAHDIGEDLQHKLELLDDVDRAHVHLDFDTDHGPEDEHKNL